MDAMGCRKSLARLIRDQGADYVLGVKSNQEKLHMLYARCKSAKERSRQAERLVCHSTRTFSNRERSTPSGRQ